MTFTALGLISALMGRMFGDVGSFWKYVVAAICLVMGLQLLGLFKLGLRVPQIFRGPEGGQPRSVSPRTPVRRRLDALRRS